MTKVSDDLRRFIHSIKSVPHLEAMLLLHESRQQEWEVGAIARRLYLGEEQVKLVMGELCMSDICAHVAGRPDTFVYHPQSPQLDALIGELAAYYAHNLIEVTNMIHAKPDSGQRIQQFADAFKWRKDK